MRCCTGECPTTSSSVLPSISLQSVNPAEPVTLKKIYTLTFCVSAKSKMLTNNERSCYCPLKQHGHGQCLDSVPSQDLAVTKYRVKKQTALTTQMLMVQYHVVIWIPWIPSVHTDYLKVKEGVLQLLATITKLIDLASCSLSRDWPHLHKSPTSLISS